MLTPRTPATILMILLVLIAGPGEAADGPISLPELAGLEPAMTRCGAGTPGHRWATHYADHPDWLEEVLERASPWLGQVAERVRARGLPLELVLLPAVESGYDPFAYSHWRAAGSWQLLAETARDQGLAIERWYDARRDMLAATPAALNYLETLAERFDRRWPLALAAYNAGPGRVARAVRTARAGTDPLELGLPGETRIYLQRIQGLSCLFSNPSGFGIRPARGPDPDGVAVIELDGAVDLAALALAAELDITALVSLNAGFKRHITPPDGPHRVIVPAAAEHRTRAALVRLGTVTSLHWGPDNIRRGDTAAGIARRHDAVPEALIELNGFEHRPPQKGQRVLIPPPDSRPDRADYARVHRQLAELQQRLHPEHHNRHTVRTGEDLWVLSQRFSVSEAAIRRFNGLGRNAGIRPGQSIAIPPGPSAARPHEYRVQSGDTLWSIARDRGVSLTRLRQLNGLPDGDIDLRPGRILTIGDPGCCAIVPLSGLDQPARSAESP